MVEQKNLIHFDFVGEDSIKALLQFNAMTEEIFARRSIRLGVVDLSNSSCSI